MKKKVHTQQYRKIPERKLRNILLLILALAALRGVIYSVLIPFDRTPDEKHHFQLIKAKQLQLEHASEEQQASIAAKLQVTWMYLLYPESDPDDYTLEEFADSRLPEPLPSSHGYYLITAGILSILSLDNMRDEIYVIRLFSIACGVIVVWLAFLVARELFPDNPLMLLGVPVFIAFIPQFSAMNGSINNDKLAEVVVSLLFLLMLKIFKHGLNITYLAIYFATMGLAFFVKRTAIFLIPLFLVFILLSVWKFSLGWRLHGIFAVIALAACLLGGGVFLSVEPIRNFIETHVIWIDLPEVKHFLLYESYLPQTLKLYAKFFIVLYWSFWGIFGYMTIHLHHFWYMLAACAQCLAIGGMLKQIIAIKRGSTHLEAWKAKSLYVFAVSIIFIVVVAFLRSIIFRPEDPVLTQGRYLFTTIIPIGVLTIWGFINVFPARYHRLAGLLGFMSLLILDAVCISNYILLNFHFRSLF